MGSKKTGFRLFSVLTMYVRNYVKPNAITAGKNNGLAKTLAYEKPS